jgi:hypothetical protein
VRVAQNATEYNSLKKQQKRDGATRKLSKKLVQVEWNLYFCNGFEKMKDEER